MLESKAGVILGLFFVFFFVSLLADIVAQQESVTITTYYPSPYGSYNELDSNMVRYNYQTALPTCDATLDGMTMYGTNDGVKDLYLCKDLTWVSLSEPAAMLGGYDLGGYTRTLYFEAQSSSSYEYMDGGNWSLYAPLAPPLNQVVASHYTDYLGHDWLQINFKAQPAGNYNFTWQADVDVDQYDSVTKNHYGRLSVYRADVGNEDITENLYDTARKDESAPTPGDWTNSDNYSTHKIERTYTKYFPRRSTTVDVNKRYRISVYKNTGTNYLRVRVNNATLTVSRASD